MFTFANHDLLRRRGLSVLRSMGAWVAIRPEQTYVATAIPGLGRCKSTYCQPQRRELPESARRVRGSFGPLLVACVAALGVLSGCATSRPVADVRHVTDRGQNGRGLADCQIYAAPVSPGGTLQAGAPNGNSSDAGNCGERSAPVAAGAGTIRTAVVVGTAAVDTSPPMVRGQMRGPGLIALN